MFANYHTHTYLCHHASGTMEEYVLKAIKQGLKILGFSDHNPCPFRMGYKSSHRIDLEYTETYINEILRLKEKYKNEIEILIGYEMEYYPREFETTLKYLKNYPLDYLILGQHFTNNEYDGIHVVKPIIKEELTNYVNAVIEAMGKGVFSIMAHPDIPNYREDLTFYKSEMTRLLKAAKETNTVLEFNLLGVRDNRMYPYMEFWKWVAEVGNLVIIGCDAHRAEDVAVLEEYNYAKAELEKLGITPLEKVELIKP